MTKLRKQGCPMDSVESVRAWRQERQSIAQRKPEPRRAKDPNIHHLAHAEACMQAAAAVLEAGASIDAFSPTLRAALAAVPVGVRDRVHLHLDVMKALLTPVLALFPPRESNPVNDDGTPTRQLRFEAPAGEVAADALIPCTIATSAPVSRYGVTEVLDCSPAGVDLSRAPLPLIVAHDTSDLSIGLVENLRAAGDRVTGEVRFSSSPEAQQVRADVVAGIHRSLSVGSACPWDMRCLTRARLLRVAPSFAGNRMRFRLSRCLPILQPVSSVLSLTH